MFRSWIGGGLCCLMIWMVIFGCCSSCWIMVCSGFVCVWWVRLGIYLVLVMILILKFDVFLS